MEDKNITERKTFSELARNSKRDVVGFPRYRLALLGDCATQHLATAFKGLAYTRDFVLDIFDADYDQILAQVIDQDSEMYRFKPDSVLIFMCVEKLYTAWREVSVKDRAVFAEKMFMQIAGYWDCISTKCSATILQFTFAESDDFVFGNHALKQSVSFIYQVRKLNVMLMEGCVNRKNVFLVDLCGIQMRIGRKEFFDPKLYYIAKMSVALVAIPLVAADVISIIQALRGMVKKCVVLDLDNTLWGGVIGEDGLSGIQVGELGTGYAFSEFQAWLKELRARGVLLAVCSKNNEEIAREPFEKHKEMKLTIEDFSVFIANWEDKVTNIHKIREMLNISMDSMVFVDDNSFERYLVRSLIPEITVPDLPEDPAEYLSYLQSLNLFETASFSEEDLVRTDQYRAKAQSEALQSRYASYEDYLKDLKMEASVQPFDAFHTPRIAQLTQRSNQFNLRTVRYTEAGIEAAAKNPSCFTLYFTLRDKFADHGLISVVIMEKRDTDTLFVDTWLMSCRVLKRGMEEFIVNKMIATARRHGFKTVVGEYIKTPKNAMVADIYEKLGFMRTSEIAFTATVNCFSFNKTFVEEL